MHLRETFHFIMKWESICSNNTLRKIGVSTCKKKLKYPFFSLPSMVFPQSFSTFKNPRREWFCLLDEEVYNLVRSGITGGPSMLYTRYHEVGVTLLHPHDYGEKALSCQSILGYFNRKMKLNFFE